jgi:hypothetical protein
MWADPSLYNGQTKETLNYLGSHALEMLALNANVYVFKINK